MRDKIIDKTRIVREFADGDGASSPVLRRPWETWASANLPIELLDRIAVIVDAQYPDSLRRRTFPKHPTDVELMMTAVVFEDYLQKINFRSPTSKQIKAMELVARIVEELENTIERLEEPALFRLHNAHGSLKVARDEIRKLANAARSAAKSQKKSVSNRPLRSFKHNALHLLIEGLYLRIVVEARGKLTIWQDSATGELKGTLPEILELLRPYLHGVLPKKMHFSTLHRALARAKKPPPVIPIQKAPF
jgi:hypothetical protein